MTFFRVGPAGIPGSIKTDMNNVLNKKFGTTAQDYPPTDWPADVNLLGELEVKTASGSIASFTDGADDVPLDNGVFDVDYTGTAITGMNIYKCGLNMFNASGALVITAGAGAKTVSSDGLIVAVNPASDSRAWQYSSSDFKIRLKSGAYTVALFVIEPCTNASGAIKIYNDNNSLIQDFNNSYLNTTGVYYKSISLAQDTNIGLMSKLYDGEIKIMFTVGAEQPATFDNFTGSSFLIDFDGSIYGGFYNSVSGILTSTKAADGTDLVDPVETDIGATPISSILGDNNIYCDTGDTSVDYRSSGTVTTITPTLITKSITDNGTYNAAEDNADGYSQVTVNVSGGGSFTPTFTETLIADNTAHASSFTLSDSYSNYDLVKIVWYESASSSGYVVTTPDILDEIFTTAGKLCINKLNTNLYICYSKAGLTWTQTNQRTLFVHEIYGITLTNCTMTATDIYKRGSMSTSAVTITSLTSLKDYDLFALSSQHSTDGTETMPCSWFIPYPDPNPLETAFGNPQPCALEEYNQNNETFYMSEYEMTAAKYFMVQGLIFTPTV